MVWRQLSGERMKPSPSAGCSGQLEEPLEGVAGEDRVHELDALQQPLLAVCRGPRCTAPLAAAITREVEELHGAPLAMGSDSMDLFGQ